MTDSSAVAVEVPSSQCGGGDYLTLVADGPKRGQIHFVAASLDDLLANLYK